MKFSEWLAQHRQGAVDAELTEKLAQLAENVSFLHKVGELTFRVKIRPGKNDADYVEVEDVIIAKVPEAARPNSIYWPDPEGLSRKNPTQERMFPDAPKALSDGQKGGAE
jgi:hypothetical protein